MGSSPNFDQLYYALLGKVLYRVSTPLNPGENWVPVSFESGKLLQTHCGGGIENPSKHDCNLVWVSPV